MFVFDTFVTLVFYFLYASYLPSFALWCGTCTRHRVCKDVPVLSVVADMAHLSLQEHDGSSGASDQDTLAPLLHPAEAPWPSFPYQYPPSLHDAPHHHAEPGGGSTGSHHSEGNVIATSSHALLG